MRILDAYSKATKVIESCENMDQLSYAKRYCNLFFEYYSKPSYTKYGFCVRQSRNDSHIFYDELKHLIKEKRDLLCQVA